MVVTLGLVACNKDDAVLDNAAPKQKVLKQEEMIPIAKLNDKGEIELLFLQRNVQEFFNKEFPDVELLYVEVYDEKITDEESEVALRYKIQYKEKDKIIRASSIEFSIFKEMGIYYAPVIISQNTRATGTFTCSGTCTDGCDPLKKDGVWVCTTCNDWDPKLTCEGSSSTSLTSLRMANFVSMAVVGSIPIARITDNNKIELLFLQKDVQELLKIEFPDVELLYIEVYDNKPTDKISEVVLRYKIQDKEKNIMESSIEFSIYKKEKLYYYAPYAQTTRGATTTCSGCTKGCEAVYKEYDDEWYCTACEDSGTCKKSSSVPTLLSTRLTMANYVSRAALAYMLY